ncbi:Tn3 family transposase [Enterobacter kobei]|uniref:Tn3 family transposase n=1 Tax=Enterobacter kobei TaxID=208224 RepID=UPI00388EFAFC
MNADNLRKVPADAPTAFIKPRWKPLVITPEGLDRKFYEICALSELKNALRSGDIWVKGSRQFRDFDDYLLPAEKFAALKREQALPPAINPNSDQYRKRLQLLDEQLATVTRLAKDNELPDAILTESGLKITPLDAAVPDRAQALIDQTSQLLPRIKITELLMDVDDWTGFSRHFTHLKDGAEAKDRTLLLSAILGDAINLGLTKMAESSPGLTYAKLSSAASPAHPRRNLFGGLGRAGQPPVSPRLCRPLGRRHDLILRWPALPRGWPGREHRARQPEVR